MTSSDSSFHFQQAALLSLDVLAREFGGARPQLFKGALTFVLRIVETRHPAVLTAALLATSTLITALGVRLVPHISVVVPALIRVLEESVAPIRPNKEELGVALAWIDGCGMSLLGTLSLFIHPYLPQMLRPILRLTALATSPAVAECAAATGTKGGAADLGCGATALGDQVTAISKVIANAVPSRQLLPVLAEVVGSVSQAGAPALVHLLGLLQTHLALDPEGCALDSERALCFQILFHAFSHRELRAHGSIPVEAAASACLTQLVARLNDAAFATFWGRALGWAFPAAAAGEGKPDDVPSHARALTFFRIFHGTQTLLQTLFTPYFAEVLPHALALLPSERHEAEQYRALTRAILVFVELGMLHGGTVPERELRTLEKALVASLGFSELRALEASLLACLGALIGALGPDGSPALHHALCMATRSERLEQRLGALRGLARIYDTLGNSALSLAPEAMPFLSEMLEDGDQDIRAEALSLMRTNEFKMVQYDES
jgi:U3 small nucleolar RNA-associated protein 10|tara:strand:+ start:475 stop:1956 length:1482 start_codon:yes stop_codon:yes gene_type:complete